MDNTNNNSKESEHSRQLYRLHYINFYNIGSSCIFASKGETICVYEPFMLPKGMAEDEAFKILSYLTDFIEKTNNLKAGCETSVEMLNNLLKLNYLGFESIRTIPNGSKIKDLFTITGRTYRFLFTKPFWKYFEWYTPNVTLEEIKEICSKYSIKFYNPTFEELSGNQQDQTPTQNKIFKKRL